MTPQQPSNLGPFPGLRRLMARLPGRRPTAAARPSPWRPRLGRWHPARPLAWARRAGQGWLSWSLRRKAYSIAALSLVALVAVFSFLLWSGVRAALQARDRFQELEVELSHLSPVELLRVDVYQSLAGRFGEGEEAAGRARSRLRFAGLFTWLPWAGGRIQEARTQLDMAFLLARGGRDLATAYQGALESPLDQMEADAAAQVVAGALAKEVPRLLQVERDLQRARQLRAELGEHGLDSRYASLIDTYLPQVQTVTYISRVSPQVIGQSYALDREIATVGDLAADPLEALSNPTGVDRSLATISERSRGLAAALGVVRRAAREDTAEPEEVRREVLEVTELMEQGAVLLDNVTAGSRGLLALGQAMEEHGLFSPGFGAAARGSLKEAEARLALARDESVKLRALLNRPGGGDASLAALLFDSAGVSLSSVDRLEVLLERAFETTRFLQSFLGFQGPRTYLLLGQNQQEIRATGGFIGVAVQATLEQGELVDLVYHDSTTVDPLPPEYPNNPLPPEPLYWYLWMGRLLFRDANWSPYFPASAARVADLYRLGQGVQVDGVVTASKQLMVDMVELLGDVRVPGVAELLDRQSATAYTDGLLPYQCGARHVSNRGKRCFDEDLFFALRDRLTSQVSPQERVATIQLFKAAVDRGNALAHVFDPAEGSLLWQLGWNGVIRPVDHDYLLVADSSLPGHTAPGVRRYWDYQVSLVAGGAADARLRVRYDHQGTRQPDRVCRQSEPSFYGCYWNFFRIYLPPTATDIAAPPVPLHQGSEKLIWGYPDPDSRSLVRDAEVGPARLTEVGGFIAVEPGTITTVPLDYRLPWEVVRPTGPQAFEYRLLVQKQPGMDRDRVSVAVELPAGAGFLAASPEPAARAGRWVTFDFPLDADRQVAVGFTLK